MCILQHSTVQLVLGHRSNHNRSSITSLPNRLSQSGFKCFSCEIEGTNVLAADWQPKSDQHSDITCFVVLIRKSYNSDLKKKVN